jgi:hypothetical protein
LYKAAECQRAMHFEIYKTAQYSTEFSFSSMAQQSPSRPGLPHCRCCTIILRHTTVVRTPLGECSARHTDLYLTTHNTNKKQIFMPPAVFEPTLPAS